MKPIITILLFFVSVALFAQAPDNLNAEAEPKGGDAIIAIVYYKIDFTQEQTDYLRTHEAELIFSVSERGRAVLEKVNDIDDSSVIDSMMRVNDRLPEFFPKISNGKAVNSIYFMKLSWPHYNQQIPEPMYPQYAPYLMPQYLRPVGPLHRKKLSEFESYTPLFRYDLTIGGILNAPMASAATYANEGGGMRMDCMFFGNKGWGGGFSTLFYSNKRIRPYPGTFARSYGSPIPTMMFTFNGGKLIETSHVDFIIQFEPGFVMQEVLSTDMLTEFDNPGFIMGFSPGVSVNAAIPIGPGHMNHFYAYPTAIKNYLNLHIAARPLLMNYKPASGVMFEVGVSYRLALAHVREYKLK
jgi:hypothetical protein